MTIQELNPQTIKQLEDNVSAVFKRIDKVKSDNDIDREVIMLAATKTVPAEVINYVTQNLGVKHIGENRVQELLEKYDKLDLNGVELHFIGKLQTNKVKYIVDKVNMIHSVDSFKLAKEIDTRSKKIGKLMDILVEINSGREENKSGVFPDEAHLLLQQVSQLDNIRVRGLMTIAPVCAEKEDYRKYFAETYSIFIDNLQNKIHNICMDFMSMGMTDSFEVAIEEGSNVVRIGSAIFGSRY